MERRLNIKEMGWKIFKLTTKYFGSLKWAIKSIRSFSMSLKYLLVFFGFLSPSFSFLEVSFNILGWGWIAFLERMLLGEVVCFEQFSHSLFWSVFSHNHNSDVRKYCSRWFQHRWCCFGGVRGYIVPRNVRKW